MGWQIDGLKEEWDALRIRVAELEAAIRDSVPEIEAGHRQRAVDLLLNALIHP